MMRSMFYQKILINVFISVFACYSLIMAYEKQLISFPGVVSQVTSPDKKYVLINVDSESEEQASSLGGNHALYLRKVETDEQTRIYSYNRHVEVLWSPKSGRLLVNDFGGSDFSIPRIFSVHHPAKPLDLREQLKQKMRNHRSIFDNHHVYIVGTEWLSEDKLKIKIYGYGDIDPDGFVLWFEYLIGKGFNKPE